MSKVPVAVRPSLLHVRDVIFHIEVADYIGRVWGDIFLEMTHDDDQISFTYLTVGEAVDLIHALVAAVQEASEGKNSEDVL